MDRLKLTAVVLAAASVLSGCHGGSSPPARLLYGEAAQSFAPVERSVIAVGRVLDPATLGRRFTSCPVTSSSHGGIVVERIGVFGESLTFTDRRRRTLYSCDGGTDPAGERRPPWCGSSAGRLVHGTLLDPRLDIVCRDRKGAALAYAWVEPVASARWVAVDQGSYAELYEVLAALPVRVATRRGIEVARARARFRITQYDAAGKQLVTGALEAAVAG